MENSRLLLSYSRSQSETNDYSTDARGRSIGLRSDPLQALSVQVEAEKWGQGDDFDASTARGTLFYSRGNWSTELSAQLRVVRFHFVWLGGLRETDVELNSRSYGVQLGYFGFANWDLHAGHNEYYYSRDLSGFNDSRAVLYVTATTLSLASSLERQRDNLGLSRHWDNFSLSAQHIRSQSGIDDSRVYLNEASAELRWRDWQTSLRLGQQQYSGSSSEYAALGLGYSW